MSVKIKLILKQQSPSQSKNEDLLQTLVPALKPQPEVGLSLETAEQQRKQLVPRKSVLHNTAVVGVWTLQLLHEIFTQRSKNKLTDPLHS